MPDQLQVERFHVDHIVPESRGGETTLDNLASACPPCNLHKWAHIESRDPETGETVPLYNPRVDRWDDHFQWSDANPFEIEGKTPSGRATVVRLQLNDPRVIAIPPGAFVDGHISGC